MHVPEGMELLARLAGAMMRVCVWEGTYQQRTKSNGHAMGEGKKMKKLTSLGALKCRKLFLRADERAEVNNML